MHRICYQNSNSTWDEALPMGNGHFGAMVYNEGNELIYAVNHYDVYYNIYQRKKPFDSNSVKSPDRSRYNLIQELAMKAHADEKDPAHQNYNYILSPELKEVYGMERNGRTMPMAGELHIIIDEPVGRTPEFESSLEIENALYKYSARETDDNLNISSMVCCERDVIITRIEQTGKTRVKALELALPERRYLETTRDFKVYNEDTACCISSFCPPERGREKSGPFHYIFMIRVIGAEVQNVIVSETKLRLDVSCENENFSVIAGVVTEEKTKNLLEAAVSLLDDTANRIEDIIGKHGESWKSFWNKSKICISDKMLEKLWYLHLYSLECCSGKGARIYEQACGMNGLWDIKQPSQWGSHWYWDVNIEQSFWPVYTSNHLEIGEAFYKGLLHHVNEAKKKAVEFYGFRGIAADYPFEFFVCIWPWCAQYFWWHYCYSNDIDFLRKKAYPLFRDILMFFEDYLKYDDEKDQYYIFPDVSPEQGPVTRNSTIALACLKFLLRAAVKANEILKESEKSHKIWSEILNKLPDYPMGESDEYGKTIKDSEWSPPTQGLAHSSPLMPIYPVGDISKRSSEDLRQVGKNTVKYAEEVQAIGTHNFGWEACAAARLGYGDEAVRLLYEKGIAYFMRANGMFAEETERWMQNCNTALAPSYQPALIEAGSATVAAVNEMLLQSVNGIIEVFPALPQGIREVKVKKGIFDDVTDSSSGILKAWEDCYFENLLAEGAFEVSAYQSGAVTSLVKIKSLAGNIVNLVNPFPVSEISVKCEAVNVSFKLPDGMIIFETLKGKTYEIKILNERTQESMQESYVCKEAGNCSNMVNNGEADNDWKAVAYTAPSKRRVFLGKDENTAFLRELDNMIFDYYQGDVRTSRITVYKFDFSLPKEILQKDYSDILPKQYHACGKQGLDFVRVANDCAFKPYTGFGWESIEGLEYKDAEMPDPLRRDCVCGSRENKFKIELPRGQYQIFLAAGDFSEPSYTAVEIDGQNGWKPDDIIKAGRFEAVVLPVVQKKDGIFDISLSSIEGYKWKINMMIINRIL